MKIGVFGDSFADENMQSGKSWISWLRENDDITSVTSWGIGGTSLEYSYQKFLENHNDYDRIIFLATEPNRMHMLDHRLGIESLFHKNCFVSKSLVKQRIRDPHSNMKFRFDGKDDTILKGLEVLNQKYMDSFEWKCTAIEDAIKYKRPDSIVVHFDLLLDLQALDFHHNGFVMNETAEETEDRPCHMSLKQNEEFAKYILQENFLNTFSDIEKYYTISNTPKEAGIKPL